MKKPKESKPGMGRKPKPEEQKIRTTAIYLTDPEIAKLDTLAGMASLTRSRYISKQLNLS